MGDIYVDASAPANGDGTTRATAFLSIKAAVDDANARGGNVTIHIEPGKYVEAVDATTVNVENVKIVGRTALARDARGLATGDVTDEVRYVPVPAAPPAPNVLLRAIKSGFEIEGIVFAGGVAPSPPTRPSVTLLWVDGTAGAAARTLLERIAVRGNCFVDTFQGARLSHGNAVIEGNYFGRNVGGFQCSGAFEDATHPEREQKVVFRRNRVVDSVNIGAVFGGHPSVRANTGFAGPGASHVEITDNDFTGNGDCREPRSPGVHYPAPIQYSAVLFNLMHGESSDPLQTARVDADIRDNTFLRNGYGVAVGPRLPRDQGTARCEFHALLVGNTYCSNGLNDLFADFNLPAQSHLGASGGPFRHAVGAVYTIDATGDGLTLDDVDYDHPEMDPRLPVSAPGTLVLGNTFVFNDLRVPPHATYAQTEPPPEITRPASGAVPIPMVDKKPPRILSATATPSVLWPANNQMVHIDVAVKANGGCDPDPRIEIESVTSDEPGGPSPQWQVMPGLSVKLRAARNPSGDGRTYTIRVKCTDMADKHSTRDVTVFVPRNQP